MVMIFLKKQLTNWYSEQDDLLIQISIYIMKKKVGVGGPPALGCCCLQQHMVLLFLAAHGAPVVVVRPLVCYPRKISPGWSWSDHDRLAGQFTGKRICVRCCEVCELYSCVWARLSLLVTRDSNLETRLCECSFVCTLSVVMCAFLCVCAIVCFHAWVNLWVYGYVFIHVVLCVVYVYGCKCVLLRMYMWCLCVLGSARVF